MPEGSPLSPKLALFSSGAEIEPRKSQLAGQALVTSQSFVLGKAGEIPKHRRAIDDARGSAIEREHIPNTTLLGMLNARITISDT